MFNNWVVFIVKNTMALFHVTIFFLFVIVGIVSSALIIAEYECGKIRIGLRANGIPVNVFVDLV